MPDIFYSQDQAGLRSFISRMGTELEGLLGALQNISTRLKEDESDRNKLVRKLERDISKRDEVTAFLDEFIKAEGGEKAERLRRQMTRAISYILISDGDLRTKALERADKVAREAFALQILHPVQEPLRQNLPEESLRGLLPSNIVVDVDGEGRIKDITERMGNKLQTMKEKIGEMKALISRYNNVVSEVKKDMNDPNPHIRVCAVMTAVIMETGIRPGRPGNKSLDIKKTKETGSEVKVDTFGATTLNLRHFVGALRDDFVEITFTGKRLVKNTAAISDRDIAKVVKSYVDAGKNALVGNPQSGDLPVFRRQNGHTVSYYDLAHYMRRKLKGLKTRDFRRLKATREFLNAIVKAQVSMRDAIKKLVDAKVKNLRARVAAEIVGVVEGAYAASRESLSHEPTGASIYAYINTEVVLKFLANGGLDDTFEKVILDGAKVVKFDLEAFKTKATSKTAGEREYCLRDVLSSLEADLNDLLGFEKI